MGSGASAAKDAVTDASSEDIRIALDQLSSATFEKLQDAMKQKADAAVIDAAKQKVDLLEVSTQGSDAGVPENTAKPESCDGVADNSVKEELDAMSTQGSDAGVPEKIAKPGSCDAVADNTAKEESDACVSDNVATQESDVSVLDMEELEQLDMMQMSTHEKWAAWAEQRFLKKLEDTLSKKSEGEDVSMDMMKFAQYDSFLNDTISFLYQYLDADEDTNPKPWKTADDKEMLQKLLKRMTTSAKKASEIFRSLAPEEEEAEEEY